MRSVNWLLGGLEGGRDEWAKVIAEHDVLPG